MILTLLCIALIAYFCVVRCVDMTDIMFPIIYITIRLHYIFKEGLNYG